jgi:plasmid stabilization system protein ParE
MALRFVDFHPLAERELQAAYRWYFKRSPGAAERFRLAVGHVVELINVAAELGSPFREQYRWMRARRFPFLIYYEIRSSQSVMVYAVAHARRRQGYWLRRRRGSR